MASVSGVLQWRGGYGLFRKYRRKKVRRDSCPFSKRASGAHRPLPGWMRNQLRAYLLGFKKTPTNT